MAKAEKIDRTVTLDPKVFRTETREFLRSEIHFADYNPRIIDDEGKKQIARSIRNFGIVGGILINSRNGVVISGHQRIAELDRKFGYPDNDYRLKAETAEYSDKEEKELNILLNNPNVGGRWDYDKFRVIIPEIDFKNAGLTDADLNMIGVDFTFQSDGERELAEGLEGLMRPLDDQREEATAARRAEREAAKAEDVDYEAKVQHMKDVKQQVRDKAVGDAEDMDAYIMLSFDHFKNKAAFCERFGYSRYDKFIKGEVFAEQVERVE